MRGVEGTGYIGGRTHRSHRGFRYPGASHPRGSPGSQEVPLTQAASSGKDEPCGPGVPRGSGADTPLPREGDSGAQPLSAPTRSPRVPACAMRIRTEASWRKTMSRRPSCATRAGPRRPSLPASAQRRPATLPPAFPPDLVRRAARLLPGAFPGSAPCGKWPPSPSSFPPRYPGLPEVSSAPSWLEFTSFLLSLAAGADMLL